MVEPRRLVVVRYLAPGRRHAEPFTEVTRLPYDPQQTKAARADALCAETGMPAGTATWLLSCLDSKLASPKAVLTALG